MIYVIDEEKKEIMVVFSCNNEKKFMICENASKEEFNYHKKRIENKTISESYIIPGDATKYIRF